MKIKKCCFIIYLIFIFTLNLYSKFYESQIYEYSGEVSVLGIGGVSSGKISTVGITPISPASAADVETPVLSFNYGDIFGYNNFLQFTYLHPTLYGVLTGNVRYFGANTKDIGLNSAVHLNLSFSKIFTEKLFVGIGLNFLKAEYKLNDKITFGANFGGIYHLFPYNEKREDKFIENIRLGASILNIGNAISQDNEVISPPFVIRTGPSISMNTFKNLKTIFSFDIILRKMKEIYFGVGLENIIKNKISLRLGYNISSPFVSLSLGGGYKFQANNIQPEVNYALLLLENKKVVNFLGVNVLWGTIDTTPPSAKISVNVKDFSPNYDGKLDYLEIYPQIKDNKILKFWEIEILDKNNNPVKKYASHNIDVLEGKLTFKKILTRLFEKKKEADVPDKIIWDGIDEKGKPAPDGEYKIVVKAYDEKRNETKSFLDKIKIDRIAPDVKLIPQYNIFSPDGDGVKDTIKIKLDLKTEIDDDWILQILDQKENVIKSYKWKGKEISEIEWDGKNYKNELAPDGNYDILIRGEDSAGNFVEKNIKSITLTTAKQSAAVSSDLPSFSPNNDGLFDKVIFDLFLTDKKGVEKWALIITDSDKNIVKSFEGTKDIPEKIEWDGKNNENKILPDGVYYYKFEAEYDSGAHPESFPKPIVIDNTPPQLFFEISPETFSPDNDSVDDILKFIINVNDNSEIKKWNIIVEMVSNNISKQFKVFEGETKPAQEILWNGLSDKGELVQSKYKYFVSGLIEDNLGNKTKIEKKEIKISSQPPDVDFEFSPQLFSPDDDGINDILKIRIFSYDKKKIKKWHLGIYPIRGGKRESLFKSFSGEDSLPSSEITWDGKNEKGELVESAMDYELELIAEDVLGNIKKIVKTLNVDVLVIKTPYGWKIKISNIEFEYNKADLKGNAFKILDRVTKILEKYEKYKVKIVGHTDNIGSLEFNMDLSRRRAESVRNYLVKKGISQERLEIEGKAFTEPVAPNDTEEGRAKNRRVEFLLIRPGEQAP